MSQPVKLSDSLVLDARLVAEVADRSIAGQIEFWAGLGRAIETHLRTDEALALKKQGNARPLSACLAEVETAAGQARAREYLQNLPFPHYEMAPNRPGLITRIEQDGTRTIGRFVNREFVPSNVAVANASAA